VSILKISRTAAGAETERSPIPWKKLGVAAAIVCAVVVFGLFVRRMLLPEIPLIQLTEDGVVCRVPYFSRGGSMTDEALYFTFDGFFYCQPGIDLPEELVGEKLGYITSAIREPEVEEGMLVGRGNFVAEVYAVKGYDPSFMLGVKGVYGDLSAYICQGGFIVKYGHEIFRDELHLPGDHTQVRYQTKADYLGSSGEYRTLEDHDAVERFLAQLCAAEFLPTEETLTTEEFPSYWYRGGYYLQFIRSDGTTTTLRLYDGGWVSFTGMNMICVKIPEAEYEAFTALLKN